MANKTDTEVIALALQILNYIGADETADASTASLAGSVYTGLHTELQREFERLYKANRVSWAKDAVPEEYFPDVAGCLADRLVSFLPGVSETGASRGQSAGSLGRVAMAMKFQRHAPDQSRVDRALHPRFDSHGFPSSRG